MAKELYATLRNDYEKVHETIKTFAEKYENPLKNKFACIETLLAWNSWQHKEALSSKRYILYIECELYDYSKILDLYQYLVGKC